jgi:hypothetical protein
LGGATAATTLSAGLNQISEGPPSRRTARNGSRRTAEGRDGLGDLEGFEGLENLGNLENLENLEGLAWAPDMQKD